MSTRAPRVSKLARGRILKKVKAPEEALTFYSDAPRVGLEPTTNSLTGSCSTIELPRNVLSATGVAALTICSIFCLINQLLHQIQIGQER